MSFLQILNAPFQFAFLQNAFIIAFLVAIPMSVLSCFLVLKGWSLMGDALSHGVFPGVVLAYMIGFPYAIGAFIAGMFCAVATGYLGENSRVKQDTVMGIVYAGMFGIGLVLFTQIRTDVHLNHILFGNMLGVDSSDIWLSAGIALFIGTVLLFRWRDFSLHIFDPVQAHVQGLPIKWLHYGLLAMLSLAIVSALASVGIILAIALLITPGAIAFMISRRFGPMLITSLCVTILSSIGGLYLSIWIDSDPASTIVLLMTAIFIVCFVAKNISIGLHHRKNPS